MLKINHIAKTFNRGLITEKTALADVHLHLQPVLLKQPVHLSHHILQEELLP